MPLYDVGYRAWKGKRCGYLDRILLITTTGIRLAAKSSWVRRMMLFAWLPVVWWGVGFFAIEQSLNPGSAVSMATQTLDMSPTMTRRVEQTARLEGLTRLASRLRIPQVDRLIKRLKGSDEDQTRNLIWGWLMMTFFRYPQSLLILFLIGATTPTLISRDIRSRAFLLYFSRPIGRIEYLLGKLLIPICFIVFVSTLPAFGLYLFAVAMSPNLDVLWSTWDIPLRILLATVALVIPTSLLALMFSSLTQESRFANFSWFAVWSMGHGAWLAVVYIVAFQMNRPPFQADVVNHPTVIRWSVLSLYNNLGDIQSWIFGFREFHEIWPGTAMLLLVSLFSFIVLYRRISAPIRV